MVTMTTIQPPSGFLPIIVKMQLKITLLQMLPKTTILNVKILNFVW